MNRWRLGRFDLRTQPNGRLLLWDGHEVYGEILSWYFPDCLNRVFRDHRDGFRWGTFVRKGVESSTVEKIEQLLRALQSTWLIGGCEEECYAMDLYMGTAIGAAVHRLKYCSGSMDALLPILVEPMVRFVEAHPGLRTSNLLLPMPSSATNRIPREVAAALSGHFGITVEYDLVSKRPTIPMKDIDDLPTKQANISGAFTIQDPAVVHGRHVIVVDDTIGSGATMWEILNTLKAAGAVRAIGLSCAKNITDK